MYPTSVQRPSGSGDDSLATETVMRDVVPYKNFSSRFKIQSRNFERQYAHLYAVRLAVMRKELVQTAQAKWGNEVPITKLCDLNVDEDCIVIGTIYKDMQLKPSILKEISEKQELTEQPVGKRFVSESDKLILEDELQRITLVGLDVNDFVTGVVIAVRGSERDDDRGNFHVIDYCFKQLPQKIERSLPESDSYVVLLSGIQLGYGQENLMAVNMLIDLLTGNLGDFNQQIASSKIIRVIIAGDTLSEKTQSKDQLTKARYLTKKTAANSVEAMKVLDDLLVQLVSSIDTDLMPGQFDPVNFVMPQQPFHKCMFPQSNRYNTLHCVSNPYECEIHGVRFLCTSGQNINDIEKFADMESNMDILESTLSWCHVAPTAPDTLGCYPYYDEDPFIITTCPDVYIAGNQPRYDSRLCDSGDKDKVRLVTVPRFSQTRSCVLVNLRTLESQEVVFDPQF